MGAELLEEEVEVGQGQITEGHGQAFRFYSKSSGEPLEGFRQRSRMIGFIFT